MEEEEETWEGEGQIGFKRNTFYPRTQFHRRFAFNSAQARLFGLHPEEAMARFGARDLPQIFTKADGLRYLVAEMGAQTLPCLTAHHGCRLLFLCFQIVCRFWFSVIRHFQAPALLLTTRCAL